MVPFDRLHMVSPGWYLRQKPVEGNKAGGLPTLPFPSPPTFHSLSFQTNQWEGRSDPVRGKFPGFPPKNTTLVFPIVSLSLRCSTCKCTVTLKHGLWVTQGHRNRHVSIRHLRLPVNVPLQLRASPTVSEINGDFSPKSQMALCILHPR